MRVDFCTIASANYLPRVKVLEQSLKTYHPESKLHILLCEHPQEVTVLSQEARHSFLAPDAICNDWQTLAFRYEITEYNTALKPYLLEFLLDTHCDAVIYLDPDIEVFSSLESVLALFESHDLLLTPHVCRPLEVDGLRPGMEETIRAGVYNLGFIGISGTDEARRALRWWRNVCRDYCYFDADHRYFVDQFWAAALPAFIQRFHCLRDPGCNVAYWNVFQRRLAKSGNRWLVDNNDLKFFHFSGLPEEVRLVSRHQNRVTADPGTDLYELLAGYRARISDNSWDIFSARLYSFATYSNHSPIRAIERRAYSEMTPQERVELGNPFAQSARMAAAGKRRTRSFFQKYCRVLAAEGLVAGHCTLFAYVCGQIAQRIKGTQKRL
jgi:hypothetical protein